MHHRKLLTLLAGTAVFAATPLALAQSTDPSAGMRTTPGSTESTSGTASLQGTDATFLRRALEGGREEVQKAEAAMRNAQRAEVRNVAATMHEEHRRSNEKLEQLASRKGWKVPAAPDTAATDTAESDQQRRMGADAAFDDKYLAEEIRHHRETIALYRAQASSGSDPELRQFAQDSLPTLEHHLEMLQGSLSAK